MNLRTILVIVGSVVIMLLSVAVAAYFGRAGRTETQFDKGKRFTAKPGTTRENAIILTSTKRAKEPEPSSSESRESTEEEKRSDEMLRVRSLSQDSRFNPGRGTDTEYVQTISAAQNALNADDGIAQLQSALNQPQRAEVAAQLEVALAELHAQSGSEGAVEARAAFDRALQVAPSQEVKDYVTCSYANYLLHAGEFDAAFEMVEATLDGDAPINSFRVQMAVQLGYLYEEKSESEAAEGVYSALFRDVIEEYAELGPDANELVRLSAMKLSRFYRQHNRGSEADEVAKLAESMIMAPEPPASG